MELESFEDLVDAGVYEVVGIEDNEITYRINPDRALEVAPKIYWMHLNEIDEAILKAIDLGYLEMDIDPDLNVTYVVTEKGRNEALIDEE